ncbi:hypothetical protein [Streptomyces sp. NPDC019507]|uniref:hypothetical protein n=1 Tax=Streptomyces sp. NPDC019507 TaxID=3154689 RepID=UPI0033ED9E97
MPYLVALVFPGWVREPTLVQFALYSLGRFRGRTAGVVGNPSGTSRRVSMRERVETMGGTPAAGAQDGAYCVRALLPAGLWRGAVGSGRRVSGGRPTRGPGLGPAVGGAP